MNNQETVQVVLNLADIKVLLSLRGGNSTQLSAIPNSNPLLFNPIITQEEHAKILAAREGKVIEATESEETLKKSDIPKEAQELIKRIGKNQEKKEEEKVTILSEYLKIPEELVLDWAAVLGISLQSTQFIQARHHELASKRRYLISSAQNASSVNESLLNNMLAYAEFIDAEIGIIATRYKNPTSVHKHSGDVWDEKVIPFLTAKRQILHKDLVLLADFRVQATQKNPFTGIEKFAGNASCIVGSPRIEMRALATLPTNKQKFLHSTGSVTNPAYTDSGAGGKAAEAHQYGFIIVEIENDEVVHVRGVEATNDGSFNDLIYRVSDNQVTTEDTECLVWGDSHFAHKEERVTLAFRKLCKDLNITISVLHDVFDSETFNVHNKLKAVEQFELVKSEKTLQKELDQLVEELEWFENNMDHTLVVASNHDEMLDRVCNTHDWRSDLINAIPFLQLLLAKLCGDAPKGLIPYYINSRFESIHALGIDDSYILYNVELALHGHKGSNGSKGSALGLQSIPWKSIIGHSHTPQIVNGCYQVGISCNPNHGYNVGLSGWAYNGVTLNKHGIRQSITFNAQTLSYTTLY